jgi:hypothetical protein
LNQPGLGAGSNTPSDSTGAIGPTHYTEVVNAQVGLFDRTLAGVGSASLSTFTGAAAGVNVGDPQIQWDQQWGRWVYAALEIAPGPSPPNNWLAFGWSKNGDPANLSLANSEWCNFHIPTQTNIHDYPKLGHDANFILIGVNIYNATQAFVSAGIWAIIKPTVGVTTCVPPPSASLFGGPGTAVLRHGFPALNPVFTPVPGNTADTAATGYIVAIDPGYIGVWHVSALPVGSCVAPPCLVADGEIAITPWSFPTGNSYLIPQPANKPALNALDGRLTQAVQLSDPQAGVSAVWTQHTTQDAGGRTIVTWYQLVPAACTGGGLCGPAAKRQEGVLADPNLWLFNAAISPTSTGNASFIHYNTGSPSTFVDVRAQGRSISDPRHVMSGELILRNSSVADSDFSCSAPAGPPCRWGDYAGASPDPGSCSTVWGTNMLNGDTASTGSPTWVSQNFALSEGTVRSTVSTQQYTLSSSDGQTWADMDSTRLRLGAVPCIDSSGLISANADLFTSLAGVNQDIGVFVDVDGVQSAAPVVWKESGGFNGTFSPNAAFAQAVLPMPAGHTYDIRLKWKANKANSGTIYAGAGPLPGAAYSPARLTLQQFTTSPDEARTNMQPKNAGSDGTTWISIPGINPIALAPIANSKVVLSGNADLWTDTAGYNQDLGIRITGGGFGPGQVVAWKESGGFNGNYSPNAATVQATASLAGGQAYTASLVWKTNRPAPSAASIYAGAGPLPGAGGYSPTSLIAFMVPTGPNPYEVVSTGQFSLPSSDGSTWTSLGGLQVPVAAGATTQVLVDANMDLFTATPGYNQDLAIFVTDNGGPARLLAWKESGGFGGTFSPNAAFAQTVYPMVSGHTYVFSLRWKTNRSTGGSGATIYAGAGPISGAYSPTRLLIELAA